MGSSGRLVVESFEETVLHEVRARGVDARLVYLLDHGGTAPDLAAAADASGTDQGAARPPSYAEQRTDAGFAALAGRVDAISVAKVAESVLLERGEGPLRTGDLVERARDAGLGTIAWTLRP